MVSIYYSFICYTIHILISNKWTLLLPLVSLLFYLMFLSFTRSTSFKKLSMHLNYPVPPLSNPIFGHSDDHSERGFEWECHRRLGKIFGFLNFDKFHLKVADLNLINEIFIKRSKTFNARVWWDVRFLVIIEGILFNKRDRWRRSRKLIQPALAAYRMRKNDTTNIHDLNVGIRKLIDHFKILTNIQTTPSSGPQQDDYESKGFTRAEDLKSQTGFGIKVKAYDLMQALTLDVIFRIGFNLETIDVTQGSKAGPLKMVTGWLRVLDSYATKLCSAIPILRPFLYIIIFILYGREWNQYVKFMESLVREDLTKMPNSIKNNMNGTIIKQTNQENNQPERLYHILLREYHRGRFTKLQLTSEYLSILIAGFETTATTSSYILWCIAKYTEYQAKLKADILDNGIGSRYLDMFIKEVMRMFPALPNFVVRTPLEDTEVAGHKIKRGMSVYLSVHTVHYDENIWPEPFQFDPERFAEGKTYPPGAYAPFGLGHRMCAGYQLAMREMKLIVCELLSNFDINLIGPQELALKSATVFLTRSTEEIQLKLTPTRFL